MFFLFHCQFFPCSVHLYQLFVSTFCLLGTEDKLIANGVCQTTGTSAMLAAILNKYFLLLPDTVCGYYGLALKIAPCVSHVCKKFVVRLFEISSESQMFIFSHLKWGSYLIPVTHGFIFFS